MSFEKLCLEPFLPPVFLLKRLPLFKNTCNPITPLSHEVFVIIRQQISHVLISISGRQPGLACISVVLTEHVLTEPSTFNVSGKRLKHSDWLQSPWVIEAQLDPVSRLQEGRERTPEQELLKNREQVFFREPACHLFNDLVPQLEYNARRRAFWCVNWFVVCCLRSETQ